MINTVLTGEINFKTLNQKGKELKIYPDCRDVAIPGENHKVYISENLQNIHSWTHLNGFRLEIDDPTFSNIEKAEFCCYL